MEGGWWWGAIISCACAAVPGRPATVSLETEQCWQSVHGDPSVSFHLHVGVRDTGPCESSDVFIEGGR